LLPRQPLSSPDGLAEFGTDIRIRRSPTDHLLEISEAWLLDFRQGLRVCIVAGMMLAVAAFIITTNLATLNPWPSLVGGFFLTTLGIGLLSDRTQAETVDGQEMTPKGPSL
jgi:hypothetical protein